MKRFFIFFLVGIISITTVFFFAQSKQKDVIVIDWTQTDASKSGEVKGTQTTKTSATLQKLATPIKIIVDKNPVQLYWPQKITVETTPGIEVRVVTTYPNGSLNNSGTKTGYADKKGKFIIQWNIKGTKDVIGEAKVDVSVGSLDTFSENHTTFNIVKSLKDSPQQTQPTSSPLPNDHITPLLPQDKIPKSQ